MQGNAQIEAYCKKDFLDFDTYLKYNKYNIEDTIYDCLLAYLRAKYYMTDIKPEVLDWLRNQVYRALIFRCKRKTYNATDEKQVEWLKYFIAYLLCKMEYEIKNTRVYWDVLYPIDEKYKSCIITFFKQYIGAVPKEVRVKYLQCATTDVAYILNLPVVNKKAVQKRNTANKTNTAKMMRSANKHIISNQMIVACPKCSSTVNQVKAGFNASGTQRYRCKNCNVKYTPVRK